MRFSSLDHAIFSTVVYFDLLEYPLTPYEIWQHLHGWDEEVSLFDIYQELGNSQFLGERLEQSHGCYAVKGRKEIIIQRFDRYTIAERKYRTALFATRIIAALPFVRMICVCNTVGLSNAREESDIDFFIVVSHGYLMFARLCVVGLASMFGKRPSSIHTRDALCFSFFASDQALDLSSLQIPAYRDVGDIYLVHWLPYCVSLYEEDGMYQKFWQANVWVRDVLRRCIPYETHIRRRVQLSLPEKIVKRLCERILLVFGSFPERLARYVQMKIMPSVLKDVSQKHSSSVVINDRYLKFHPSDRREQFQRQFIDRCGEFMEHQEV